MHLSEIRRLSKNPGKHILKQFQLLVLFIIQKDTSNDMPNHLHLDVPKKKRKKQEEEVRTRVESYQKLVVVSPQSI